MYPVVFPLVWKVNPQTNSLRVGHHSLNHGALVAILHVLHLFLLYMTGHKDDVGQMISDIVGNVDRSYFITNHIRFFKLKMVNK